MSRLAALIARLAEKAEARDAEHHRIDTDDEDSVSSFDEVDRDTSTHEIGNEGGGRGGGASVYGTKAYWDERYEDGVVGHTTTKGELSNEWCAQYVALCVVISLNLDLHYQPHYRSHYQPYCQPHTHLITNLNHLLSLIITH
jgi:hypothetical protein